MWTLHWELNSNMLMNLYFAGGNVSFFGEYIEFSIDWILSWFMSCYCIMVAPCQLLWLGNLRKIWLVWVCICFRDHYLHCRWYYFLVWLDFFLLVCCREWLYLPFWSENSWFVEWCWFFFVGLDLLSPTSSSKFIPLSLLPGFL